MKDPQKAALGLLLESELHALLARVQSLPELAGGAGRAFRRQFFSRLKECPVDKQGRMVLPEELCAAAGLAGEIVMIGAGERIEIWSPENLAAEEASTAGAYAAAVEALGL